jgi:prepilin-type N-terminal cleavage/methylation domain-containing protein
MKNRRGFTLIELIMVLVILAIVALTFLPRFLDLSSKAQENSARAALGTIRAAVAIEYANSASKGNPQFPKTITPKMFKDNKIPIEPFSNSDEVIIDSSPPATQGLGWRYNNVNGQIWINDVERIEY